MKKTIIFTAFLALSLSPLGASAEEPPPYVKPPSAFGVNIGGVYSPRSDYGISGFGTSLDLLFMGKFGINLTVYSNFEEDEEDHKKDLNAKSVNELGYSWSIFGLAPVSNTVSFYGGGEVEVVDMDFKGAPILLPAGWYPQKQTASGSISNITTYFNVGVLNTYGNLFFKVDIAFPFSNSYEGEIHNDANESNHAGIDSSYKYFGDEPDDPDPLRDAKLSVTAGLHF